MKNSFLVLTVCFAAWSNSVAQVVATTGKSKWGGMPNFDSLYRGKQYLPFNLTTVEGKPVNSDNTTGKVTLLNFWFESCPGCRAEFTEVNEIYKRLKGDRNCEFVAITFDDAASLPNFIKQNNLQFPIATTGDVNLLHRLNYGMGCPSLVLIDKNGKIAHIGNFAVNMTDEKGRYSVAVDTLIKWVKELE